MNAFELAKTSPLVQLDFAFVQFLIKRMLATIRAPDGLDASEHEAHDRAVIAMLESLDPRSPGEAAVASHFVTAHYGSMASGEAVLRFPDGSREAARLATTGGSLARVAMQAMRMVARGEAMPGSRGQPASRAPRRFDAMQSGDSGRGNDAPRREDPMRRENAAQAEAAKQSGRRDDPMRRENGAQAEAANQSVRREDPMRRENAAQAEAAGKSARRDDPMQSGNAGPDTDIGQFDPMRRENAAQAEAADQSGRRDDPMRRENAAQAEAVGQSARRDDPMRRENAAQAEAADQSARRDDPMRRENAAQAGPPPREPHPSWCNSEEDGSGDPPEAEAAPSATLPGESPPPYMFTRSGKPIRPGAFYRPDGTLWEHPPACWQGPSWLADRFPLDPAERLEQWKALKARDELTPELCRLAYGYAHEPGFLEAHEAMLADAEAT